MVTTIEPKSLRQLAKELGVSHSYLSQVKNGKRPASEKLQASLNMVSKSEARLRTSNLLMGTFSVHSGFDPHSLPPLNTSHNQLIVAFLKSHIEKSGCRTITSRTWGDGSLWR